MSAQVIAADNLALKQADTMRARAGLLRDYWYVACESRALAAGKPTGSVILEQKIALWRDATGQVVAVEDRCRHRNAPLSKGSVVDGCLACPYHGWVYDREGQCVSIPAEGPDGRALASVKVGTFSVREQDGLVWVWMGDGTPDKEPFPMPYYATPGWGRYYMATRFRNNVTSLVENFMDVPHTVFVHRGWFRNRSRKRVAMRVERTQDSVLVTYDQPADSIGFTGRILNPKGHPMMHTDKFYMPNVTRCDYIFGDEATGFVITSQCTPVSDYESVVYTLISYKLGLLTHALKRPLNWYTRKVIEQDVDIMEVHGENLAHHRERYFTSTPVDTLHVFIESLRDWAAAGGKGTRPEPAGEGVEFWI